MNPEVLFDKFYSTGLFSDINLHFAEFLAGRCGGSPEVFFAAAFVSRASSEGHICIDLENLEIPEEIAEIAPEACRDAGLWEQSLTKSGAAVGPGGFAPLVIEKPAMLYLYRYWEYERDLAEILVTRAQEPPGKDVLAVSARAIEGFMQGKVCSEPDWQRVAACTALLKKLCIISGGPGTGKTTVVGDIISLAFSVDQEVLPRIALAAPTGKAAVRLQEAVGEKLSSLGLPVSEIPIASTIHRLLGSVRGTPYFRHDEANRLPYDLVVIDEASMVDLALMSKLLRAVPERAHLVILGDRNQLSSVEPGSVLGDLCGPGDMNRFSASFIEALYHLGVFPSGRAALMKPHSSGPLLDCVVELQTSHRFGEASGIGKISHAVKVGKGKEAFDMLASGAFPDAKWKNLPVGDQFASAIASSVLEFFRRLSAAREPEEALDMFHDFRLLCALRGGPFGVGAVNRQVELLLSREGFIPPGSRWYRGRPVMITKNDYNLNLFNGDLGIILPDPSAGDRLQAFFRSGGPVRSVAVAGLPEHETVYAMTVHKSQGAEFDEALFVLPDRLAPVLTRELIYTALTRARSRVEVWGRSEVFIGAVGTTTRRTSGLASRLWGGWTV